VHDPTSPPSAPDHDHDEAPYLYAEQFPHYEPFDPAYLREVVQDVLGPAIDHYFRPELHGGENIPDDGPLILAANHSGNSFPWDGMVLDAHLWARDGLAPEKKLRAVFEKELTTTWWMRPFGVDNFWRRGGGVDMTFDNFSRLLDRGERVLYFPEGVPGIGKGFFRRYQLQRFSSSFVLLAERHRARVVPLHIVNAEWTIPFCFTWKPIDRLTEKYLRVPFLPLPAAPLGLLFPFLWYLALPVKMVFVAEPPIDVANWMEEARKGRPGLDDRELARGVAERVRGVMQEQLDRRVEEHGASPYHARSLFRHLGRHWRRLPRILPTGWTFAFVRHARDQHRPPARNRPHAWLRDWDLLFYYLPLGWPMIGLARKWRKPPYGYRGLTPKERREREGGFHWHLKERPLPDRPPL
jgi:1-acyl-sn-glycerol-3-phosphate acyltransferase